MKQKFIVKHLASWSPLVQKILSHVSLHTTNPEYLMPDWVQRVVHDYLSRVPKGIYDYLLIEQNENSWQLFEDDELVLHLELIEIYELV